MNLENQPIGKLAVVIAFEQSTEFSVASSFGGRAGNDILKKVILAAKINYFAKCEPKWLIRTVHCNDQSLHASRNRIHIWRDGKYRNWARETCMLNDSSNYA